MKQTRLIGAAATAGGAITGATSAADEEQAATAPGADADDPSEGWGETVTAADISSINCGEGSWSSSWCASGISSLKFMTMKRGMYIYIYSSKSRGKPEVNHGQVTVVVVEHKLYTVHIYFIGCVWTVLLFKKGVQYIYI